MKKILYLSFLFEPDLSACSFRNSSLSKELSTQLNKDEYQIDLYTSMPNRYNSFVMVAPVFEKHGNLIINRIKIPQHNSGFLDQILSYKKYFFKVLNATKHNQYDLVVYVAPNGVKVEDNGVRTTDLHYRRKIDEVIKMSLIEFIPNKLIMVEGTTEQRISTILQNI